MHAMEEANENLLVSALFDNPNLKSLLTVILKSLKPKVFKFESPCSPSMLS